VRVHCSLSTTCRPSICRWALCTVSGMLQVCFVKDSRPVCTAGTPPPLSCSIGGITLRQTLNGSDGDESRLLGTARRFALGSCRCASSDGGSFRPPGCSSCSAAEPLKPRWAARTSIGSNLPMRCKALRLSFSNLLIARPKKWLYSRTTIHGLCPAVTQSVNTLSYHW